MKNSLRVHYQRQLIYAGLDDFYPSSVFPNYLGGEYGENATLWSIEVANFLDLGVRCGLLKIMKWENLFSESPLLSVKDVLFPRDPSGGLMLEKNYLELTIF